MKDITTPVPPNEVRAVIKKSLENAALVNYERLSEEARLEGKEYFCFLRVPPPDCPSFQLIEQILKLRR